MGEVFRRSPPSSPGGGRMGSGAVQPKDARLGRTPRTDFCSNEGVREGNITGFRAARGLTCDHNPFTFKPGTLSRGDLEGMPRFCARIGSMGCLRVMDAPSGSHWLAPFRVTTINSVYGASV